jgi:hypothetical protein
MRLLLLLALCWSLAAQDNPPSWNWVHAGVAAHALGSAADGYSSWQRIELNPVLQQRTGLYQGRYYTAAVGVMSTEFALSTVASYLIGWKYPRLRKALGFANMGVGLGHTGVAVYNWRVNKRP